MGRSFLCNKSPIHLPTRRTRRGDFAKLQYIIQIRQVISQSRRSHVSGLSEIPETLNPKLLQLASFTGTWNEPCLLSAMRMPKPETLNHGPQSQFLHPKPYTSLSTLYTPKCVYMYEKIRSHISMSYYQLQGYQGPFRVDIGALWSFCVVPNLFPATY